MLLITVSLFINRFLPNLVFDWSIISIKLIPRVFPVGSVFLVSGNSFYLELELELCKQRVEEYGTPGNT